MTIYFNPNHQTFSTISQRCSIEIYTDNDPEKKSRRKHKFSLSDINFDVEIESKFSGNRTNRPYIDIKITYNDIPLYPLSTCLNETISGKRIKGYSSYYQKFRINEATFDDWEKVCKTLTDVYSQKDIWFLNEVPCAIDRFNYILNNLEAPNKDKLVVCKVFMELIEECKLIRYEGIQLALSKNCQIIQQLSIKAINHDTDFEIGVKVMELLYGFMKEADLLIDFYYQLEYYSE